MRFVSRESGFVSRKKMCSRHPTPDTRLPTPGSPHSLTWAVLLGRWIEFAKSALALPADGEGRRLRDSVGDVIMLQAVWFALQHLDELDDAERAVGLDRAELLIDKHGAEVRRRWRNREMPSMLCELLADAREQFDAVKADDP